ncbi:MAG: hypothetical protein WBQ62_01420 [Dehalococcoidales bacterium]|jgi:hypothetical protein
MGPTQLLVLEYHSGDNEATSKTEAKVLEYKVSGFPTIFFNGGTATIGGTAGNSTACYQRYKPIINQLTGTISPVNITGTMTVNGKAITINSTVANTSGSPVANAKLTAVLYEDLGTDQHHYVVRDILTPSAIGNLNPGSQQTFNLASTYSGNTANLKAVLYVQTSSGQIIQAVQITQ